MEVDIGDLAAMMFKINIGDLTAMAVEVDSLTAA